MNLEEDCRAELAIAFSQETAEPQHKLTLNMALTSQVCWHIPLIPGRSKWICEFQASLVYIASSRTSRLMGDSVSTITTKKQEPTLCLHAISRTRITVSRRQLRALQNELKEEV